MTRESLMLRNSNDLLNLNNWFQVPLSNRETVLPPTSGLYLIMSEGTIYYVGKSSNLLGRWTSTNHHRYFQCATLKEPILYFCKFPAEDVSDLESLAISKYNPEWNGTSVVLQVGPKIKGKRVWLSADTLRVLAVATKGLRTPSEVNAWITSATHEELSEAITVCLAVGLRDRNRKVDTISAQYLGC